MLSNASALTAVSQLTQPLLRLLSAALPQPLPGQGPHLSVLHLETSQGPEAPREPRDAAAATGLPVGCSCGRLLGSEAADTGAPALKVRAMLVSPLLPCTLLTGGLR